MTGWTDTATLSFFLSLYGLLVVSALVPIVNGEVIVLSAVALVHSTPGLVGVVLVATASQMTGKSLLYWSGRGAASMKATQASERLARWRRRLEGHPAQAFGVMTLSAASGVPPMYAVTLLAGAIRIAFANFVAACACGHLLRYAALAFLPHLVIRAAR
jgi:membrane protein YqaA with SNARE-associated domain